MANVTKDKFLELITKLIAEGKANGTIRDSGGFHYVDSQKFSKLLAGCRHLLNLLGKHGVPYEDEIRNARGDLDDPQRIVGVLEAMKEAIESRSKSLSSPKPLPTS